MCAQDENIRDICWGQEGRKHRGIVAVSRRRRRHRTLAHVWHSNRGECVHKTKISVTSVGSRRGGSTEG
jgi:hypothetical protein